MASINYVDKQAGEGKVSQMSTFNEGGEGHKYPHIYIQFLQTGCVEIENDTVKMHILPWVPVPTYLSNVRV